MDRPIRPTTTDSRPRWWTLLGLTLAGGALTSLATGPHLVTIAAWLAPIVLLRASRSAPRWPASALVAATLAAAYAVAWNGAFGVPALAFGLVGLVFAVPYAIDRWHYEPGRGLLGTFVFPSALVALEFGLATVPVLGGQPLGSWASHAFAPAGHGPLLQLASLTGAWGITFLVGWTASVAAWWWAERASDPSAWRGAAACAGVVATVLLWGGLRIAYAPSATDTVRVAAITVDNAALTVGVWNPVARGHGIEPDDVEAMRRRLSPLHDTLFAATAREAAAGAEIVVWAEDNAIVFERDEQALVERAQRLAAEAEIHLFMGMVTLHPGELAENKVIAVMPDGSVAFEYLKSYPTPWESSRRGDGVVRSVDTPAGRLAVLICYDVDHPALARQAGRGRIDILLVPADDGAQVPWLHAEMATIRAVENGFSLVRPVIGGRALAVDPYGRVLAQRDDSIAGYFEGGEHTFVAMMPRVGVRTPYASVGDLLPLICLAFLAVAAVTSLVARRRRLGQRLTEDATDPRPVPSASVPTLPAAAT